MMTAILFFSQNDEYATLINYGKNFIPGHDVPLKKKNAAKQESCCPHHGRKGKPDQTQRLSNSRGSLKKNYCIELLEVETQIRQTHKRID